MVHSLHSGLAILTFFLLLCSFVVYTVGLQDRKMASSSFSRRDALCTTFTTTAAAGIVAGGAVSPAHAAKGAAELDFEFYMKDLLGGNQREGTVLPSVAPKMQPPRTLQDPLLPLLLNDDCSPSCLPVQALIGQVLESSQKQKGTSKTYDGVAQDIQLRVQDWKERTARSFPQRSPWVTERVSDQYYFDYTAYALWRTAAELLPDYLDRDKFVRQTGRLLYQRLVSDGVVKPPPSSTQSNDNQQDQKLLTSSIPAVLQILNLFQSSNFCKGYRIRSTDEDAADFIFDELDDESLSSGGSIDCLVSIYEPATLGASLQITGEQSRFAPDLVGPTLTALWESLGIRSAWVTFFVDPEYRPNPKDYFPNEQLLQYTLTKR